MKLCLIIALLVFQIPTYGQVLAEESFINYEEVIEDLQSTENIQSLKNKYNYLFVFILDSTKVELIEKTGCAYINELRNYPSGFSLSKQTIGFVTDEKNIKEVFEDKNSLRRILDCSHTFNSPDIPVTKFDYPIYIKGNVAVFRTYGPTWTWSDTYIARLEDGILQINWLEGIIE